MFDRKSIAPDKIRIAHVIGWLHFGGKENGIVNLVNGLDSDLFESYIFSFVQRGPLAERILPERCRVIELGDRLGGDYRLYFKLAREFRKHQIHIAHTHSWATLLEGFVGAKLAGVPLIVHGEHGTIVVNTNLHRYIQRLLWHMSDGVLSVSEALCDNLEHSIGFQKDRIRVICNGVDTSRFRSPQDRGQYKTKLGLRADALIFGAIGRLVPVKCFPNLLEASAVVFKKLPNAYLVIVGDGPLYDDLTALAQEAKIADRIKFLGWRPDVPDVLKALDVFVCSSESEGMSNTILEAMATGVPVVATAVGGNVELVADGETGRLVPANNPTVLADAVVQLLANPRQCSEMGWHGRQRVEKIFSLEAMTENYAKFYAELYTRKFPLNHRLQTKILEKHLVA